MTALIDGDSIAYIAGHDKMPNYSGEVTLLEKTEDIAKDQVQSIITEIMNVTGADEYLLFLSPSKTFRNTIYPDYKANRKSLEPPKFKQVCMDYIKTLPGVYKCENIEADDAVSICKNKFTDSIICTPDKDILMLPGKHFNYRKMEFVTTDAAESSYKFWASVIVGKLLLTLNLFNSVKPKSVKIW